MLGNKQIPFAGLPRLDMGMLPVHGATPVQQLQRRSRNAS